MAGGPDDWMLIGRVSGAHGVRGEVRIAPLTDFPDRFNLVEVVYIGDERERREVERVRSGERILLKLRGVDSRDSADRLHHLDVWIPRSEAMPLPPGQFYADDIIGLRVQTTEGEYVGVITDILRTGSNDVYLLQGPTREQLIPAIGDVVEQIDLASRTMTIRLMPGLLE